MNSHLSTCNGGWIDYVKHISVWTHGWITGRSPRGLTTCKKLWDSRGPAIVSWRQLATEVPRLWDMKRAVFTSGWRELFVGRRTSRRWGAPVEGAVVPPLCKSIGVTHAPGPFLTLLARRPCALRSDHYAGWPPSGVTNADWLGSGWWEGCGGGPASEMYFSTTC